MPGVEQELAHQRLAIGTVGLFDQQEIAEAAGIAQIGEIVGAVAPALDLAGKTEPELRLADQVERDIGNGDIFFQHRRMAAPFGNPVAEDEAIVAHAQREFEQRVAALDGDRRHHMCPTSSGMS